MINFRRLIRKFKYYFGDKIIYYNDPVPEGFLKASELADSLFDETDYDMSMYYVGVNKNSGNKQVIVRPYNRINT